MALTTPANRRSAATTSVVWGPSSVTPDSAKDAPWRSSAGWGYEGISTGFIVVVYRPMTRAGILTLNTARGGILTNPMTRPGIIPTE